MNNKCILLLVFLAFLYSENALGQKKNDKQLSTRVIALTPEEQIRHFHLAPGFVIELVASETDGIVKPIDLAFDDAGNLWTQTARMYPLDPVSDIQWNDLLELMDDKRKQDNHPAFRRIQDLYKGITQGEDQVLKLSGIYNGKLQVDVWADGLALPMSVLPYKNGAYIAQGSEIFFLDDENRDGKADTRKPLFTGFGFTDTHTMSHLLLRGPGNRIHFSHGALNKGLVTSYVNKELQVPVDYSKTGRFSLDGKQLELLTAGLNNIWGFTLRANGQWYGSEANDIGYSVVPLEEGAAFSGIGNEKFRPYQPFFPSIHPFRVGGTGLSGLAFSEDKTGGFPEEWKNVGFLANPITNSINAVRIVRNADGSFISEHLPDLLTSDDDWFRPVNITFGPDGNLYIADWYNKIVSHNEVPTTHPDRDKKSGRIWRIRHMSQQNRKITDFHKVSTSDLPSYLKSDYLWEKRAAWHQISDRDPAETKVLIPGLQQMSLDLRQDAVTRIHALWCLETLGHYDVSMINSLLSDADDEVRRETLRYLASFSHSLDPFLPVFRQLIEDRNPLVRSQLIRTIGVNENSTDPLIALLLSACKPPLEGDQPGGPYERKFERYLARRALEKFAPQLEEWLSKSQPGNIPSDHLVWAIQVLPVKQRAAWFFQLNPGFDKSALNEETFLYAGQMASEAAMEEVLKSALGQSAQQLRYMDFALKHRETLNLPSFRNLLAEPLQMMLKSDNHEFQQKALNVMVSYNVKVPEQLVGNLMKESKNEGEVNLLIRALDVAGNKNTAYYKAITDNETLSLNTRLNALQGIARTDKTLAKQLILKWFSGMDQVEQKVLTNTLSRYAASSDLLLDLYAEKKLPGTSFEMMTAERLNPADKQTEKSSQLMNEVRKAEVERKQKVGARIAKMKTLAEKNNGDPKKGELLFQTCLMCHQAGGKGQTLAPALDGLGYRETEGLLYAVLDPDAAIESGYAVFRIVKKDNSILEGYLLKRDANGSTLAAMGGGETFVPAAEIKSQHSVTGKSFMPAGLFDNFTDKDVSDILTYIKTIK